MKSVPIDCEVCTGAQAHSEGNVSNGSDKGWSFTDCTRLQLMHRLKITDAFAFDRHIGEAGFNRLPNIRI
ncbi:hypothetical protein E6H31_00850 [Candidatus Bathyarchaeota archaeon]|nr:MAG: hypothetical protein E6H31_00850 [Candidatus Bathyarchaeota archaeon]